MGIGGREYAPHVRKMVCVYGVDLLSKYKPGFIFVTCKEPGVQSKIIL